MLSPTISWEYNESFDSFMGNDSSWPFSLNFGGYDDWAVPIPDHHNHHGGPLVLTKPTIQEGTSAFLA